MRYYTTSMLRFARRGYVEKTAGFVSWLARYVRPAHGFARSDLRNIIVIDAAR